MNSQSLAIASLDMLRIEAVGVSQDVIRNASNLSEIPAKGLMEDAHKLVRLGATHAFPLPRDSDVGGWHRIFMCFPCHFLLSPSGATPATPFLTSGEAMSEPYAHSVPPLATAGTPAP